MTKIELTQSAIDTFIKANYPRKRMTPYRYEVLENGHIPGYLSGSNLTGKAKSFGVAYMKSREMVSDIARALCNAEAGYAMVNSRRSKIWVDCQTKKPVRISVIGKGLD